MKSLLASLLLLLSPFAASHGADPETVSYYHLRFKLTSTSDWAALGFDDTSEFLGWRQVRVGGAPIQARSNLDHIFLVQELAQAEAGESMSLTADWAVPASTSELLLTLEKGDLGASQLQVLFLEETTIRLVAEISHEGAIPDDPRNPLSVRLDLSVAADYRPRTKPLGEFEPMVWAFYYPWYGDLGVWDSPLLSDRPAEPYVSHDRQAIERHVTEAQAAGVDGFISSWWGPHSYTDDVLPLILEVAAERDFKISIIFEILDDATGQSRPPEELLQWLVYLLTTHTGHSAYMKVDGRPVVVNWASEALPLADWGSIFSTLRRQRLDAFYLAMGLYGTHQLARFDGLHEYALVSYDDPAAAMTTAARLTRHYHLLHGRRPRLWAATVTPGYDDRLLPDRDPGILVERSGGSYYRSLWDAALATEPDWLLITSWNEWWENTHIELSQDYGTLYLQITAEYSPQLSWD